MQDREKSKARLVEELLEARSRIAVLESEARDRSDWQERAQPTELTNGSGAVSSALDGPTRRSGEETQGGVFFTGPEIVMFVGLDGTILDCNRAMTMTGVPREEIIGKRVSELGVFGEDDQQIEALLTQITEGSTEPVELGFKTGDGEELWVEIRPTMVGDGSGARLRLAARSITERKWAEKALRASEEKYRLLADNSLDLIWRVDMDLNHIYANQAYLDITGYTVEEIESAPIGQLYTPEELRNVTALVERELAKGSAHKEVTFETSLLHKDGYEFPVEIRGRIVRDDEGNPTHIQGSTRDITERKRAEEKLHHLRNDLSNIIDSMPSVLIGVNPKGDVTQWNTEAQRVTGVSAAHAIGQPLAEVFPRLGAEMERVEEALTTGEVRFDPRRAREEDGEARFEDVTIYPLLTRDTEGAVIRVDDVTEQVRIEEMMVQSEKMLSVGGLAAGMAHEINNPLAGMMLTASVVNDRLTNLEMPANIRAAEQTETSMAAVRAFMVAREVPKMLDRINDAGRRASEIVSNMLSFARKSDASFFPHDLADLLDQTVNMAGSDYNLKKRFDFRQIEIVREYEDGLPPVACERGKIQQVLLNILRNGAEAMQDETDHPRFILRLTHQKDISQVCIEISDNGPGMNEATRKRAFEPFFTTKPTDQGTGLGLSVSYFIITKQHDGQLKVESTPHKETTFSIHLPVVRKS